MNDRVRRRARRRGDSVRVELHLTDVARRSRKELAVGLEVHDRPASGFLERQIDDALDERAVVLTKRDRRLAPARAALVGGVRPSQEVTREHAVRDARRRARARRPADREAARAPAQDRRATPPSASNDARARSA